MFKSFRVAALAFTMTMTAATGALAYGAIAVEDEEGFAPHEVGYGAVINQSSKDAAMSGAMRECRKAGNQNCKVVVWFETCGAYAASRATQGVGYGSNLGAAKNKALDACGDGCKIVAAVCE